MAYNQKDEMFDIEVVKMKKGVMCDPFSAYDRSRIYRELPARCVILGKSGSGKTSLIKKWLIPDCVDYDDNIFGIEKDDYKFFTSSTDSKSSIEELSYMKLKLPENTDEADYEEGEYHSCYFFDDIPSEKKIKDIIDQYFKRSRHCNISTFLCLHSLDELTPVVKNNFTVLIFCKNFANLGLKKIENLTGASKTELKDVMDADYLIYYKDEDDKWAFIAVELE